MQYKKVTGGYLLRLERGEEVQSGLIKFIKKYKIKGGFMVGLGACEDLELGYFDAIGRTYINKKFAGEYEITNLTGNIAYLGKEPIVHAHVTLSDKDCQAFAGHLWHAVVSGTVEVFIHVFQTPIKRAKDEVTGLNLLKLTRIKL